MSNIVILRNNGDRQLEIIVEEYKGTLEHLRAATRSRTIAMYPARMYCKPFWNERGSLLVVCDDDGKIYQKPPTMPIYEYWGNEVVDIFVGDLAFVMRQDFDPSDDRGLTEQETDYVIERLKNYYDTFRKLGFKVTNVSR